MGWTVRKSGAIETADPNAEPDPDAVFECDAENEKAAPERERLTRWREFAKRPWVPGPLVDDVMAAIQAKRTIWLKDAIDLMAFSWCSGPMDLVEQGARRTQACRALSEAVQDGRFALCGSNNKPSDDVEEIPAHYFSSPRRLGGDNILEIDLSDEGVSDQTFDSAKDRTKWFDVRFVEPARFIEWLLIEIAAAKPAQERLLAKDYEPAYKNRLKKLIDAGEQSTRPEDEIWGRQRRIKRDVVRKLREAFAPPEWSDPGRPSKE